MTKRPTLAALLAVLALASLPAAGISASVALGDGGELYIAKTGPYGELFPDAETGIPATRPVLAVDVLEEGEPPQRLLLPGTEGPEEERSPTLGFETSSQTLYAIWESQREPTLSALYLSGLAGDGWSEPVEISGNISPLKGPPRVEIMSEAYRLPSGEDGEVERKTRTLFHVVWWEQAEPSDEAYYAAVLLDDGAYPGWNPVLRLNAFAGPEADEGRRPPRSLVRASSIRAGSDIRSSIVGFADASARRFVTLEARLLPPELGRIADDLRGQIIEIGRTGPPDEPSAIHRKLRGQIIEIGREFNPGVINHFANRVLGAYDTLAAAHPDAPIQSLADDLRGQIIEIGARLLTDVADRPTSGVGHILEIREPSGQEAPEDALPVGLVTHLVQIMPIARLPIPPVGPGAAEIFVSEDGLRSLVSWRDDGEVFYTESVHEAERVWSVPKKLVLGEEIGPGQAEAILRSRVSRRR